MLESWENEACNFDSSSQISKMVPAMNFGVVVAMTFDGMFLVVCACGTVSDCGG